MPGAPLNMVQMSVSGTPGTGNVTLGSAVSGYQTFANGGAMNGQLIPVTFTDAGGVWEACLITYSTTGPTLTNRIVRAGSSGVGVKVSLTSAAIVSATLHAEDMISMRGNVVAHGKFGLL